MVERSLTRVEQPPENFQRELVETGNRFLSSLFNPNTKEAYNHDLKHFRNFLTKKEVGCWSELSPELIQAYIFEREKHDSIRTVNRRKASLRSFLQWKRNQAIAVDSVFSPIEFEIYKKNGVKPHTTSEFNRALRFARRSRDKTILHLIRHGLSPQTLTKIQINDLSFSEHATINLDGKVPPRKFQRTKETVVRLDRQAQRALELYLSERTEKSSNGLDPESPLLTGDYAHVEKPLGTKMGIWKILNEISEKSGVRLSVPRLKKMQSSPL